ncbi:hypothetical protein [Rhodococcus sp. IEGM 1305]|uniref:Uncharacterized protein n=1 Tax=Rhodococcus opacus TaxID=37919 RepID=A0A2S8J6A4_RHOOP|nr:hypothetical protein [Rhodococcus sp. IEGM 1305]MDI9947711.1 hypothetical protein [Rhodococcus sp. IEGM 1305]PQP22574.1 hypothetical protein C5613_23235 [Rhodococcus opacus]
MTTLTSGSLLVDQTDGSCRITFNRQDILNAQNPDMLESLGADERVAAGSRGADGTTRGGRISGQGALVVRS